MFDLDKEVDKWILENAGSSCFEGMIREELKDHLYCEIEKNIDEGLSEESAFLAATRRLGLSEDLMKEFGKTPSNACESAFVAARGFTTKQILVFNVVFLVCFAALVFGSVFFFKDTPFGNFVGSIHWVLAFVPIVFALNHRRQKEECRAIKRFFGMS